VARERTLEVLAELVANVMAIEVVEGDQVVVGDTLAILESMKMEIPVIAERAGTVRAVKVAVGEVVQEGDVLVQVTLTD
jgi:acetyl-CoA carboxylase biotin carboxyl carrier protein